MNQDDSFEKTINKNVELVLGDHKRAIRTLAWPMILSMFIMNAYNLIDGIWVAGLGAGALAAVGFVTPMFNIIGGIANGLGAGTTSLIARYIGAKDKENADFSAAQAIVISIIASVIISIFLLVFQRDILLILGAKDVIGLSMEYSTVIFVFIFLFVISSVGSGILRAEGDVKRAMYAMILSAVVNIVLDPIFIYVFGWGVAGAAWATIVSAAGATLLIMYWILIKRDTFITLKRSYFKFKWKLIKQILDVGIPSSFEMVCVAITIGIFNAVLMMVGGVNYVAAYTAGMRFIIFAMVPATGISTATVTVAGAAYGSRNYLKLKKSFNYSVFLAFIVAILVSVLIFIYAEQIALLFSYSPETAHLTPLIADFLRIMTVFLLAQPFGIIPSSAFQAMGKGFTALALTIIRENFASLFFAFLFVFFLMFGPYGVWWGKAIGKVVGGLIGLIYIEYYMNRLIKTSSK